MLPALGGLAVRMECRHGGRPPGGLGGPPEREILENIQSGDWSPRASVPVCSVLRLSGYPAFAGARLPAVAIIQNTAVEIASALIRDWRMYWAKACMMAWCRSSTMP